MVSVFVAVHIHSSPERPIAAYTCPLQYDVHYFDARSLEVMRGDEHHRGQEY